MRRIWRAIIRFFLPPAGSPAWRKILPFVVPGVLTVVVIYGSVEAWTYTNSSEFCGTICHTMPPEYSAYLRSPHARVQCVECHIGRDVVTTQFTRKAGDARHVYYTLTESYEFPITTRNMRPARESCETCHFPEKFSDDSLREIRNYSSGETEVVVESTYLVMKTGGGSARAGLGRGIHWHIENEVWFLATDPLQQDIPYVRTVDSDGAVTEYYDIASGLTPDDVAGTVLERMDCITCHNRITHFIPDPFDAIDQALFKNLLPNDLPFIWEQSVEAISGPYVDQATDLARIEKVADYYQTTFPAIYAEREEDIQQAVKVLKDIYLQSVFPEQKLDWKTHANNLGHKSAPGCFRCHDGKHLTGTGEAIRLECNLCHSVPVVAEEGSSVVQLEIVRGPEPASHTHTSWITLHGRAIDISCASCHPPNDANVDYIRLEGDKPPNDGSFCGNLACHAKEWVYTGFDTPELEPILARQLYILQNTSPYLFESVPKTYEETFKPMIDGRCVYCHSGSEPEGDLDLSSYDLLFADREGGPAIVPGDPGVSLLIQRQSTQTEHFGQLLSDELQAIRDWIAAGAPQN